MNHQDILKYIFFFFPHTNITTKTQLHTTFKCSTTGCIYNSTVTKAGVISCLSTFFYFLFMFLFALRHPSALLNFCSTIFLYIAPNFSGTALFLLILSRLTLCLTMSVYHLPAFTLPFGLISPLPGPYCASITPTCFSV